MNNFFIDTRQGVEIFDSSNKEVEIKDPSQSQIDNARTNYESKASPKGNIDQP
jgi:hypothetical protein